MVCSLYVLHKLFWTIMLKLIKGYVYISCQDEDFTNQAGKVLVTIQGENVKHLMQVWIKIQSRIIFFNWWNSNWQFHNLESLCYVQSFKCVSFKEIWLHKNSMLMTSKCSNMCLQIFLKHSLKSLFFLYRMSRARKHLRDYFTHLAE